MIVHSACDVSIKLLNWLMLVYISTELGNLSNATQFFLMDCLLEGPLPSELGRIRSLRSLHLQGNQKISGTIPAEFAALGSDGVLQNFNITGTSITGELPESVCKVNDNCPKNRTLDEPEPCMGLNFDCSPSKLCGCGCTCATESRGSNISHGAA